MLYYHLKEVNMKYFDAHTHIFPAKIAEKAVTFLEDYYHHRWPGSGDINDLLSAMDQAQVSASLIFSCATRPEQVTAANDFLAAAQNKFPGRFYAFGTLHPDHKDISGEFQRIKDLGLKGLKIHPDFQKIYINEPKMMRIYELAGDSFPVTIHMGDRRTDFSSPWRLAKVLDELPHLKVIAAHFGGYSEWDEVKRHLVGREVWFDTSSTFWELPAENAREIALAHGTDKILFASDYPASLPAQAIADVLTMNLSDEDNEKIFHLNAEKLFGLEHAEL
jgi:predicted TIM-barrel fold metal-dependent hydrolase